MTEDAPTNQIYRFPWREDNYFELLVDGPEFFPRMLQAIDSSQQYILLEMYLIESGTVTDRFIDALLKVAERGVQVYLLLDDYGAIGLKPRDRTQLAQQNIHIVFFNPLRSHSTLYNLYKIFLRRTVHGLYRNHRKFLLVVNKVAFTGGTGLTDEFDPPNHPEKRWRETMIVIQGPVLTDWQQLFVESWEKYAEAPLALPTVKPAEFPDGKLGRITVNEAHRRTGIQRSLIKHMRKAEHRVWFTTAYFIPSWTIRRNLKRAARSGVDVRLLLPGPITDHPGVRYSSHHYFGRLLRNGVRIFEYQPRFFHAKTVLCDNWVTIGSSNFDRWNLQWNLEASQEIDDQNMADKVKAMFNDDFDHCQEYTYKQWCQRNWYLLIVEWFWRKVELISLKIKRRRK